MNIEEFINDFYKGNDYRKFAILKEMYNENENLKKDNELLKQLKAKIIDGDDDIELTYNLGDYLSAIDCNLKQNEQICKLKKEIKQLKSQLQQSQKENKVLKKNAEHNDKVVDNTNWQVMIMKKALNEIRKEIQHSKGMNFQKEERILKIIDNLGENNETL